MSPVICFVCGDIQLLLGEARTVAFVELHTEQSFKVSDVICYNWQVILFAYTFDKLYVKVVVGSYQLAVTAEHNELQISIFHCCSIVFQRIIRDSQNLRNTVRKDSSAVDIFKGTVGRNSTNDFRAAKLTISESSSRPLVVMSIG